MIKKLCFLFSGKSWLSLALNVVMNLKVWRSNPQYQICSTPHWRAGGWVSKILENTANVRWEERHVRRRCVWDGPCCLPCHLTYPQMSYSSSDSLQNKSAGATRSSMNRNRWSRNYVSCLVGRADLAWLWMWWWVWRSEDQTRSTKLSESSPPVAWAEDLGLAKLLIPAGAQRKEEDRIDQDRID